MVAIITVLFAFPLGYFLRNRTSAYLAYVAIYAYSFTFQTLYLLRSWVGDSRQAFPADPDTLPFGYLAVTAGIYAVGFLLITFAHRLATKRRTRTTTPINLDA
jgi:ABC-type branched-subunit amino acid transport system permease subunit